MDIRLGDAQPTPDERAAVDALLGAPASSWHGGSRGNARDMHVAFGGQAMRVRRHLLLPALEAVQSRVGWISEGALNHLCARLDVPPAEAWGVATFYALLATAPRPRRVLHVCDDIACQCRGADALIAELEQRSGPAWHSRAPSHDGQVTPGDDVVWMRSPCLGRCDQAPAAFYQEAGAAPVERSLGAVTTDAALAILSDGATKALDDAPAETIHAGPLLARAAGGEQVSIAAYLASGGYDALHRALAMGAGQVISEVQRSGLVGRGGAAFPTGRKWAAVAAQPARPHYLVCNADESEPGTFKDRVLMERDPHAVIEAMIIAAFACGCEHGYLYVRGEYPLARQRIAHAVEQARERGFLGARVMDSAFSFDIEVRAGAGAYICGEETAIFNSIEGYRGEPRNKPPYPAEAGLFGKPTVVNNVETLVNVLPIVRHGGAAFADVGTAQSTGTRLFCLSGCVLKPGLYEVPYGETLRDVIAHAGGVPEGRTLRAVLLGGAAGVFVRPDELDIPLTLEGARAANATLGSGVVMVFDDSVNLERVLLRIAAFFRDESCGQCVPCRVGTVRQEEALHRLCHARTKPPSNDLALLDELGAAMRDASICGLGQTAYSAVESAIHRLRIFDGAASAGGGIT